MWPVIGICGNKGAGKDTVGAIIQRYISNTVIEALAKPLKEFCREVYRLTQEQLYGDQKEIEFELKRPDKFAAYEAAANHHFHCGANDALLEWDHDLPARTTPRHIMQTLGTEWGRNHLRPSIWSDLLWHRIDEALNSGKADLVVVTDVRFRNEALAFLRNNAKLWRLTRSARSIDAAVQSHQSETELQTIPSWYFSQHISNNASLEYLDSIVSATLRAERFR